MRPVTGKEELWRNTFRNQSYCMCMCVVWCGVCVRVWGGGGVLVINNDISWARSNQCSLLVTCYIYLSSSCLYHSYYHLGSVFIYLLCLLFLPLPSLCFSLSVHFFSGQSLWANVDTEASCHIKLCRNVFLFFLFYPWEMKTMDGLIRLQKSLVNWKIMLTLIWQYKGIDFTTYNIRESLRLIGFFF